MFFLHTFAAMSNRKDIINQTRELFLRYGIRNVTMDDIAKALGISKKTLYSCVSTKAELVDLITEQYIEQKKNTIQLARAQAGDAVEELIIIGKHTSQSLRGMQSNIVFALRKYYRTSWQKLHRHFQGYVFTILRDNIIRGKREGVYRHDINPDIIAKIYIGKTMIIADDEIFPEPDYDPRQVFEEHFIYHIHGIASEKGLRLLKTYKDKL